ncbi:MAG: class I tRNA ligase family protein, partial [Methanosarcinales archaeon]|nr:class I tRNA ligase family protein [Methanosarcinales archaeon]
QFDSAIKAIRGFAWEVLADNYIEIAKSRLYDNDGTDDSIAARDSARFALYTSINTLSKMLAPLIPFFAEEMYSTLCNTSVHTSTWPEVDSDLVDESAESEGEQVKDIVSAIRRYKSDNKIALNAPLSGVEIYGAFSDVSDIAGAVNSPVELIAGAPDFEHVPTGVKPNLSLIGPKFRDTAGPIIAALKSADPVDILSQVESGGINIEVNGTNVELPPEAVEIISEMASKGRSVDVLEVGDIAVVILK